VNWPAVLTLAAGTYLARLAGLLLRGRVEIPPSVERLVDLGATALLMALVATAALTDGEGFAGWARVTGLVASGLAALLRAPFVVVVAVAAGVTAVLRLIGLP
jgi:branched-subunit amino acid transport protein